MQVVLITRTDKTNPAVRAAREICAELGESETDTYSARRDAYEAAQMDLERAEPVPFRAPHHTCSTRALTGACTVRKDAKHRQYYRAMPGEVSLAHGGVLLLDEADQFSGEALEHLAHALRTGKVDLGVGQYRRSFAAQPAVVVLGCTEEGAERVRRYFGEWL